MSMGNHTESDYPRDCYNTREVLYLENGRNGVPGGRKSGGLPAVIGNRRARLTAGAPWDDPIRHGALAQPIAAPVPPNRNYHLVIS